MYKGINKRGLLVAGTLAGALMLVGCGDEIYYEPGVYKGKEDATGTQEAVEARAPQIRDRGDRAFTDRGMD